MTTAIHAITQATVDRCKAGHERRQGKSMLPLSVTFPYGHVRVFDPETGGWTEWDVRQWRVRRVEEHDPAAQ